MVSGWWQNLLVHGRGENNQNFQVYQLKVSKQEQETESKRKSVSCVCVCVRCDHNKISRRKAALYDWCIRIELVVFSLIRRRAFVSNKKSMDRLVKILKHKASSGRRITDPTQNGIPKQKKRDLVSTPYTVNVRMRLNWVWQGWCKHKPKPSLIWWSVGFNKKT